jgi:hypothetical protein
MKPKITSKIWSISSSKETHPHKTIFKDSKTQVHLNSKALTKKRENSKVVFHKKNQENIFPKNT